MKIAGPRRLAMPPATAQRQPREKSRARVLRGQRYMGSYIRSAPRAARSLADLPRYGRPEQIRRASRELTIPLGAIMPPAPVAAAAPESGASPLVEVPSRPWKVEDAHAEGLAEGKIRPRMEISGRKIFVSGVQRQLMSSRFVILDFATFLYRSK